MNEADRYAQASFAALQRIRRDHRKMTREDAADIVALEFSRRGLRTSSEMIQNLARILWEHRSAFQSLRRGVQSVLHKSR